MDFGLGDGQRQQIEACYQESVVNNGLWNRKEGQPAAYAATNPSEYWAELTMWYFGTHGEYCDRERCAGDAAVIHICHATPETSRSVKASH